MKKNILLFGLFLVLGACSAPKAVFVIEQDSKEVPATVSFKNVSKNADSYIWDFGDGNGSEETSPKYQYAKSGRYMVKLTAKKGSKMNEMEQEVFFDAPEECLVRIETTEGTFTIQLSDETPKHRDNFIKLVKEGFYNEILFHRVIGNFMIQGGDPNSKGAEPGAMLGSGGPGYKIDSEIGDKIFHVRGALAAARQGDQVNPEKKSSGSQFYIVHGNEVSDALLNRIESQKGFLYPDEVRDTYLQQGGTPFLDGDYTVFGKLVDGFDVLDAIANTSTDGRDRPLEDIKIVSTEIVK